MISNVIVTATLVFAGLYCLCWLLLKDFRRQVEQPKYRFLEQLDQFGSGAAGRRDQHDQQ